VLFGYNKNIHKQNNKTSELSYLKEKLGAANNSVFNLHFMNVSTENDNNFRYEKITIVVDNIPLNKVYKIVPLI
jgi:hypothetical protein